MRDAILDYLFWALITLIGSIVLASVAVVLWGIPSLMVYGAYRVVQLLLGPGIC